MGVYLFVLLFSQSLHHHKSIGFSDVNKTEKSFSISKANAHGSDCLSCHFLLDGHALLSNGFEGLVDLYFLNPKQITKLPQEVFSLFYTSIFLRGPPFIVSFL